VRGDKLNDVMAIPLDSHGAVFCFENFKPIQEECDTCARYDLTYEST
jgi:hypothetical protein